MTLIQFTVVHTFDAPAKVVWDEMVDWESHGAWIPATRVVIDSGDVQSVGGKFTGYTGYGPLTLVDRMVVTEIEWDAEANAGSCEVEKLVPVLTGRAGFRVLPEAGGSRVEWFEEVSVRLVPRMVAPLVSKVSAFGFSMGMRQLAKVIARKSGSV